MIIVINADVNMHAADHHASTNTLQVIRDRLVPLLVRVPLRPPPGKRMSGRGDWRQSVPPCDAGDTAPQVSEMITRVGGVRADSCCNLDL
jgi:hypothetical protein